MINKSTWGALIGALGTSFFAALCCFGPFLAIAIGAGGAWASFSAFFAPYRFYLIILATFLFGYAFYKLYIKPPPCGVEAACISPKMLFIQRVMFWIILAISIALIAFPWYA